MESSKLFDGWRDDAAKAELVFMSTADLPGVADGLADPPAAAAAAAVSLCGSAASVSELDGPASHAGKRKREDQADEAEEVTVLVPVRAGLSGTAAKGGQRLSGTRTKWDRAKRAEEAGVAEEVSPRRYS